MLLSSSLAVSPTKRIGRDFAYLVDILEALSSAHVSHFGEAVRSSVALRDLAGEHLPSCSSSCSSMFVHSARRELQTSCFDKALCPRNPGIIHRLISVVCLSPDRYPGSLTSLVPTCFVRALLPVRRMQMQSILWGLQPSEMGPMIRRLSITQVGCPQKIQE